MVAQSALRRSANDLLHLIEVGGKVRLVKGAYHENEQIAFASHDYTTLNYWKYDLNVIIYTIMKLIIVLLGLLLQLMIPS